MNLNITSEKNDGKPDWPGWRLLLIALNIVALAVSVILNWHYLQGEPVAGCGSANSCGEALNSKWSLIAGVPVSALAAGAYFAMLGSVFFIGRSTETSIRHLAWYAMLVLAGLIAGCAIWFTIIQQWIIGHFCFYCMTMHITGIALAALITWRAIKEFKNDPVSIHVVEYDEVKNISPIVQRRIIRPLFIPGLIVAGVLVAGIFAATQYWLTSKPVYTDGRSSFKLPAIDYHNVPVVGSPDAANVVILLFDYQCPHCQQVHTMLDEAIDRYKGKLAFALCPAPLNTQCNPYVLRDIDAFKNSCELAKTGLAVWKADRKMYTVFESWMFMAEPGESWHPRSMEAAKAKAVELVGKAAFDVALSDPFINGYMQTSVGVYGQTIEKNKGGVPRMVFGSRWVVPEADNINDLVMMLQQSLGLPAPIP